MRNYRSDPTANAAIGAVDRELKRMRAEARRIGARYRAGELSREEEQRLRSRFRGIFRRLLDEELHF